MEYVIWTWEKNDGIGPVVLVLREFMESGGGRIGNFTHKIIAPRVDVGTYGMKLTAFSELHSFT